MSLKQDLETHLRAVQAYEAGEYDVCLAEFERIAESSKVQFNIAIVHAGLGDHELAIAHFNRATSLDQFMAISYFQRGVSHFIIGDFATALADFDDALHYLRGNTLINYEQLGLKFKLYSCEILFNRALCYLNLGQERECRESFRLASALKQEADHDVIDDALRPGSGATFTVFSVAEGTLFRPSEQKIKNLPVKDFLGKARLIASVDSSETFVGFTGFERQQLRNNSISNPVGGLPPSQTPSPAPLQLNKELPRARDPSDQLFPIAYSMSVREKERERKISNASAVSGRSKLPPTPPRSEASSSRGSARSGYVPESRNRSVRRGRDSPFSDTEERRRSLVSTVFSARPRQQSDQSEYRGKNAPSRNGSRYDDYDTRSERRRDYGDDRDDGVSRTGSGSRQRLQAQAERQKTRRPSADDTPDGRLARDLERLQFNSRAKDRVKRLYEEEEDVDPFHNARDRSDHDSDYGDVLDRYYDDEDGAYSDDREYDSRRRHDRRLYDDDDEYEPSSRGRDRDRPSTSASSRRRPRHQSRRRDDSDSDSRAEWPQYTSTMPVSAAPAPSEPAASGSSWKDAAFDDTRLKVKVIGVEQTPKVVTVALPTTIAKMKQIVGDKLSWGGLTTQPLRLRCKDEDGELVCMDDEDDFVEAHRLAVESAKSAGRLVATLAVHVRL